MHEAGKIANKLLELAGSNGKTLTPMQLLKLVYMSHGWMLGIFGKPLIRNQIEAWKFGPVIPDLYQKVKAYRDQPINITLHVDDPTPLSPAEESLIRQVYSLYGDYSGPELSRLTHQPGSPWDLTYDANGWADTISNDVIEDHYRRIYQERAQ